MKKPGFFLRCFALTMIAVLTLSGGASMLAESDSASVIQLLDYEGDVHILDADGNARPITENDRVSSGESLVTGEKSMASVSLDTTKILTLDAMTRVDFSRENNRMTLTLSSGQLLLDVQQKLDENETLEIKASTMTVGIRGTIVFLTSFDGSEEEINRRLLESNPTFQEVLNRMLPDGSSGSFSQLVVLEGAAAARYENAEGQTRSVAVHAGEKLLLADDQRNNAAVSPATGKDLGPEMLGFVLSDPVLSGRVNGASDMLQAGINQETKAEDEPGRQEPVITDDIPPEHVHNFNPDVIPPTCTADGVIIYRCGCGESFTISGGNALGHDWGPWSVVRAATAEQEGQETCQCTRCGEIQTRLIPKLEIPEEHVHTPKEAVYENTAPATCTAAGSREAVVYCETCGGEISRTPETLSPLGHQWDEWETVAAPDCVQEGQRRHTCQRCGETETETLPANGHTPVTDPVVEATCTKTGLTEGKHCSVCNAVLEAQQTVDAKGHTEAIDPAVAATCTKTGLTEGKHCSVCNAVLEAQQTVDAKGHTEATDAAVAATCTKTGLTEGKHCSVCGTVLVAQQTVDAKGHTEEIRNAVEASCHEGGYTGDTYCLVCGEKLAEGKATGIDSSRHAGGTKNVYYNEGEDGYEYYVVCLGCGQKTGATGVTPYGDENFSIEEVEWESIGSEQ